MIALSDLIRLGQLYPSHFADPRYAFAGGSAVQCWLHDSKRDRIHNDIDLFAFKSDFLKTIMGASFNQLPLFNGAFTKDGIVVSYQDTPNQLHIIQGGYYDSEITPDKSDVRLITIKNTSLLVLSPEFIVVSKLSYPNVHRLRDLQDVLALNQHACIQDVDYLSALIAKTSISKLIKAQDILELKTKEDLQGLLDFIHLELIRRFLDWDYINVDALNPFQFFVLMDVEEKLFSLPFETLRFIENILRGTILSGRKLQIAKLGLYFLTIGIPSQSLSVLQNPTFQSLIHRGLASIQEHPSAWLVRTKNILMMFQQLNSLEDAIGVSCEWVWQPVTLIKIMQRILFDDSSRLALVTLVKSIHNDLTTDRISASDCMTLLHKILAK